MLAFSDLHPCPMSVPRSIGENEKILTPGFKVYSFAPVVDGTFIQDFPSLEFSRGHFQDVPLMVTRDKWVIAVFVLIGASVILTLNPGTKVTSLDRQTRHKPRTQHKLGTCFHSLESLSSRDYTNYTLGETLQSIFFYR